LLLCFDAVCEKCQDRKNTCSSEKAKTVTQNLKVVLVVVAMVVIVVVLMVELQMY